MYEEDCDEPIRLWLSVLCITLGFHALFILATEILSTSLKQKPGVTSIYLAVNTILQCFLFLWMLVGAVWATNDREECEEDFYEGWRLTMAILVLYFGMIALILLSLCFIVCVTCFGSWHISRYMNKNTD